MASPPMVIFKPKIRILSMRLDSTLSKIAGIIRDNEAERKILSKKLCELKTLEFKEVNGEKEVLHETLVSKMKKHPLNCKVGGVDGGVLSARYHTIDLMVMRAVAPVFTYEGKLKSAEYYPEKSPEVFVHTNIEGDEADFMREKNIRRQMMELDCAREAVESSAPDYMLLHGPMAPYPTDKPKGSSSMDALYRQMIASFTRLYKACEKNNTKLCGVVEDSRGARLTSILADALPQKVAALSTMRDTALLYDVLDYGERTFPFKYALNPSTHPVISDLGEWGSRVYSFYAKTAQFDRPVRIDFLSGEDVTKSAKEISSIVFTLSCQSRVYGIPTVITEADQCAKLRADDINFIYDLLKDKVGNSPSLMKLRREARPFG